MSERAASRTVTFDEGLSAYASGEFYEAHEFWEELWQNEDDDDTRTLLQALIQIASAMHKACAGVGPRGSLRLLDRADERLAALPEDFGGIAVGRLREGVVRLRAEVERALAEGRNVEPAHAPPIERTGAPPPSRARPPDEPLDPARLLAAGVAAYQRGLYFDAHEHWELVWRDEADPTMKSFLSGLILVTAAMHKLGVGRSAAGAARLFAKASSRLAAVPDGTGGMAVATLRDDVERARAAVLELTAADRTDLEPSLVPRMVAFGSVVTPRA